jgi:tetratricopeptide (TPR) repeat protein
MKTDIKQRSGLIITLLQVIVLSSILVSVPVRALETSNAEASDAYLRGMQHYRKTTPDDYARAIDLFNRAIELDPGFAPAHSALAAVYWNSAWRAWPGSSGVSNSEMLDQSRKLLKRAMQSPSALTHQIASEMAAYSRRNPKTAFAEAEAAMALDANDPAGHLARANVLLKAKRPGEAVASMQQAMQLDNQYPSCYLTRLGRARFDLGQYAEAAATLERATELNPDDDRSFVYLAAAYGYLGRDADAISAVDRLNWLRSEIRWGILTIEEINRWRWTGDRKRLKEGLVLAGVESGYDWYSRVTNAGDSMDIEGAAVIGIEQARQLHEAGVPFIDFSTIGTGQKSILGTHKIRWGRDNEMGPREFNLIRLTEVATKSGGMVVYHPNGSNKRWGALAAAYAVELGFENVYYLRDSVDDWKKAGYPLDPGK